MEQYKLDAAPRKVSKGAAKRLRQTGQVPGILYGHDVESQPLKFEALELQRTLMEAGSSQLIYLLIKGVDSPQPVLAREIQRNVLSGETTHVDLLAVSMTEKIAAEVTISLIGEPEAVEQGIGILLQGTNTVEIECLPGHLIPTLEIDVSGIDIGSALYVSDLQVPDTIAILSDPQEMVVQVIHEARPEEEEEEEEVLFDEEPSEVEVITRARPDDDE